MAIAGYKPTSEAVSKDEDGHWPAYYEDKGCQVSPSCLSCPLPQCKYDDPTSFHDYMKQVRARKEGYEIRKLWRRGMNVTQIAALLELPRARINEALVA